MRGIFGSRRGDILRRMERVIHAQVQRKCFAVRVCTSLSCILVLHRVHIVVMRKKCVLVKSLRRHVGFAEFIFESPVSDIRHEQNSSKSKSKMREILPSTILGCDRDEVVYWTFDEGGPDNVLSPRKI